MRKTPLKSSGDHQYFWHKYKFFTTKQFAPNFRLKKKTKQTTKKTPANKRMSLTITQHLESYIRNRNNPDSEIAFRKISQSNKGATEKRSKYLSHNKDDYFQRGLCTLCLQLQASPSPKKRGQLGLEGIQHEDLNELCSLALQLNMSSSSQIRLLVHGRHQRSFEVSWLYIWAINQFPFGAAEQKYALFVFLLPLFRALPKKGWGVMFNT